MQLSQSGIIFDLNKFAPLDNEPMQIRNVSTFPLFTLEQSCIFLIKPRCFIFTHLFTFVINGRIGPT